jgi:Tfp pilus assembly PilM family ATPase
MSLFTNHSLTPIGIDLGGYAIKAVQLGRAGNEWRIRAAVSAALPVPNHPLDLHTVRFVREMLCRHGFASERIVLAAPTQQLEVDVLEVPPRASGAPIEQIARLELARTAKLEGGFELGCWDLPAPPRAAAAGAVMAVALRHEHAAALLDPFQADGFDVLAIDSKSWAMARAAAPVAPPDGITAVLDIGWNAALMVLMHGNVLVYQRVLPESGVGIVLRAIRDEFHLADDEAEYILRHVGTGELTIQATADVGQAKRIADLVHRYVDAMLSEIQPALDYASHRYAEKPLSSVQLCGGGASIAGLSELLSRRLAIPTNLLCPASLVECPAPLMSLCGDGVLTTALGLACHGTKASMR